MPLSSPKLVPLRRLVCLVSAMIVLLQLWSVPAPAQILYGSIVGNVGDPNDAAANSLYMRDQWQARRNLTISYGVRYEYWPYPRRANRRLERYDGLNNKMLVCGVGQVPEDCGTKVSSKLFAPRVGIAWRPTALTVVRAGYGINYDPMNLGRNLRTNYPTILVLNQTGATAFEPAGTLREGIPEMRPPDLGNGIVDIPVNYAVTSTGDEFQRG